MWGSMKNISTITMELAQDSTVTAYSLGGYDSDTSKQSQANKSISNFTPFNEQGPADWQVFVCVSIILIRYRNISGRVIKDDCSGFTTL